MSDVKWIKIVTDIFDDEKILLIESMPEADAIIVIWFKLLTLAGKTNNKGVFLISDRIPYTDEMLSTIFRRKLNIVRLALQTFEQFGMIKIIDNIITIPNWGKHQNFDRLELKNEYMKNYMRDYREKQKELVCNTNGKVNSKSNSKANVSEADIDKIREDIDKDIDNKESVVKEKKKKYGTFNNVLLTQSEYEKMHNDYSNADEAIQFLSEYIEMKGYKAKSHNLAIRKWVFTAIQEQKQKQQRLGNQPKRVIDTPAWMEEQQKQRKAVSEQAEEHIDVEELKKVLAGLGGKNG